MIGQILGTAVKIPDGFHVPLRRCTKDRAPPAGRRRCAKSTYERRVFRSRPNHKNNTRDLRTYPLKLNRHKIKISKRKVKIR